MKLSKYFAGVAWKTLVPGEVDKRVSNQHEFNAVAKLKQILGSNELKDIDTSFIYFGEDESQTIRCSGTVTWYDSRANDPERSAEFRLYYKAKNEVMGLARLDDVAIFAVSPNKDKVLVIIVKQDSPFMGELAWLFGISELTNKFNAIKLEDEKDKKITLPVRLALDSIGIETEEDRATSIENALGSLLQLDSFPSTKIFSKLAMDTFPHGKELINDPDSYLIGVIDWEERMFRYLEKKIVSKRLQSGFFDSQNIPDVDQFISYSLSVQNRRKSRVGLALENHLAYVFTHHRLRFEQGGITENKAKPDFLFPSSTNYHDPDFDKARLTMLGSKSSCKDRWRQVLSEAQLIRQKHLFTLEPAISQNQTDEMRGNLLQLVVPTEVKATYSLVQQEWLFSLQDFINLVKLREGDRQPYPRKS